MGMFDHIIIEDDTPEVPHTLDDERTPQTKSLTNTMATYVIRGGKLYKRSRTWIETDEVMSEDPFFGKVYKRIIDKEWLDEVGFHGDIHITASEAGQPQYTLMLTARFNNGSLEWIRVDEKAMEWLAKLRKETEENHMPTQDNSS